MTHDFFDSSTEQSVVKALLVSKYFEAWANVMVATQKRYPDRTQRIAYIDLFAGPGRYEDNTESTPLMILRKAIENTDICQRLVTIFPDKDKTNVESLQRHVAGVPGINSLKYKPQIAPLIVEQEIVQRFKSMNLVPTLFFVDPWGYIVGGESGPDSRPMHPEWVSDIQQQCINAGVSFFFKQWGNWVPSGSEDKSVLVPSKFGNQNHQDCFMKRISKKNAGRLLDRREWNEIPQLNQQLRSESVQM